MKQAGHITSIRMENVTFSYKDSLKPAFEKFTVDLPVEKNILVTGGVGHGTSTFLKLLAVVHQPQIGSVLVNGLDTSQMSFEEFLPLRTKIGYTFDYGGLFSNRSLLENMTLPLLYHKTFSFKESRERAAQLAAHFGFSNKLNEKPASVTGGLRKLVTVLRTLLMNPEMLVMDDPFMGVDPQNVAKLIQLLNDRRESGEIRHLFLTSRDLSWPQQLGCKAIHLSDGQFDFSETVSGAA
jgi:ABC-type transporter Mla maintaining outer membrane lipid asymmetry ATPase subunit MlaF